MYSGNFFLDNNIIFGKGLVDAYVAQENYAVYPRIIISPEIVEGMSVSVKDSYKGLPVDTDDYYYIDTLERYFRCNTEAELLKSNRFIKIKEYVYCQLKGYVDLRIRENTYGLKKN